MYIEEVISRYAKIGERNKEMLKQVEEMEVLGFDMQLVNNSKEFVKGKMKKHFDDKTEIAKIITQIEDPFIQKIVFRRVIAEQSWFKIARYEGKGKNADDMKQAFDEFLKKGSDNYGY